MPALDAQYCNRRRGAPSQLHKVLDVNGFLGRAPPSRLFMGCIFRRGIPQPQSG